MISLPDYLLSEVDVVVARDNTNRSEIIREAMRHYLGERRSQLIRDALQSGYTEMAKINLHMASEAFHAEADADSLMGRLVSGV